MSGDFFHIMTEFNLLHVDKLLYDTLCYSVIYVNVTLI